MNLIQHGKSIKDIIAFIRQSIKSKQETLVNFQKKYFLNQDNIIVINRFALIEIIDEFQGIINQSLQAIEVLQTEILNLEEQSIKSTINANIREKSTIEIQSIKENNNIYHRPKCIKQTFIAKKTNCNKEKTNNKKSANVIVNTKADSNSNITSTIQSTENFKPNPSSLMTESELLYDETEPKPEQEKMRTPLVHPGIISTKNIFRQNDSNAYYSNDMISTEADYTAISSRSKLFQTKIDQMDKDKKMKSLILKISNIERYKRYFSDKYSNGNYGLFLEKLNNNKISYEDLVKEIDYLSKAIKMDINNSKTNHNNNNSSISSMKDINTSANTNNNSNAVVKTGESFRKKGVNKKRVRSESAKKQILQLNEQILKTFRQIEGL